MEEISPDGRKVTRVRELENIVKKLEEENKQLLNKVKTGSPTHQNRQLAAELEKMTSDLKEEDIEDDIENGVINLDDLDMNSKPEGEWLFVSPKLLTPSQRKQTPLQWLSEGHGQRRMDDNIPSLDDVRKSLVFNMDEAETLSKIAYPRPNTSNRTAQHYLDRVRERLGSNSPPYLQQEDTGHSIPVVNWTSQSSRNAIRNDTQNSHSVPVVRWKARVPQTDSPPSLEQSEDVPVVSWKVKQVPSGPDVIPKVAWDPDNASLDDDFQSGEEDVNNDMEEAVPIVKWKANVPQEEIEDVPVVKWKAKMPHQGNEDVPVVKWKAKMPHQGNEDVPVVKWKAKMPHQGNEDVPVVKWKAKMPQSEQEGVPVVKWKAKMPQGDNPPEEESRVPDTNWKVQNPLGSPGRGRAIRSPKRGGLLRPGGVRRKEAKPTSDYEESPVVSGDSELSGGSDLEQRLGDNLRPRGLRQPHTSISPSQSPTSLQSRRGGGLRRPARTVSPGRTKEVRSQSPSPSTQSSFLSPQGSRQLTRPRATSSPSQPTSTPGRSNLVQPSSSDSSPKMARHQLGNPSSIGRTGKHSSGLPHSQRRTQEESGQHVSRLQAHREGQAPPSPSQNRLRSPGDLKESASSGLRGPLGSDKRGWTSPKGGGSSRPRRVLPTPPSANPGGLQPSSRSPAPSQAPQQQQHQDEDSWLEGCF